MPCVDGDPILKGSTYFLEQQQMSRGDKGIHLFFFAADEEGLTIKQ
jgi:hypothetical protein